jgi:hypothetical protein
VSAVELGEELAEADELAAACDEDEDPQAAVTAAASREVMASAATRRRRMETSRGMTGCVGVPRPGTQISIVLVKPHQATRTERAANRP